MTLQQNGLFRGRSRVAHSYGRYGYTRGGGKIWHGGLDIVGLDSTRIRMPYYKNKRITGKVVQARRVTDHQNKTWEWGWYVCVKLDALQTPDDVNFLYFCHCARLLVKPGDRVASGDELAEMGATGNAAGGYAHCHFEVRPTATGRGLDPTQYAGCANKVGTYGAVWQTGAEAGESGADETGEAGAANGTNGPENAGAEAGKDGADAGTRRQVITVGPVSDGDAWAVYQLCYQRGLVTAGLYKSEWRTA